MDPVILTAVVGPWAQYGILGAVVIALTVACVRLFGYVQDGRDKHMADVKAYGDKYAEILVENAKTQTALANAIERIGDKIK